MNNIARLKKAIVLGLRTNSLPEHIIVLQKNPIIRIIRVLGGVSLLLILSKSLTGFSIFFLYLALFFSVIFCFYLLYINYYRFLHVIATLRSDKFDVRNSPLDIFIRNSARLLFCIKGVCEGAAPLGTALGIGLGVDQVLAEAGREKIFAPILAGFLPKRTFSTPVTTMMNRVQGFNDDISDVQNFIHNVKEWADNGQLSQKDATDLINNFSEHKTQIINNRDMVVGEILKEVENLKKK